MSSQATTYRQHLRATLVLGLPLVGSHLAQFAVTLVDTIMLGWYDVTVLAGQVLGVNLFFNLFILGAGFGIAVMPLVANAEGAGNRPQVRRVTRMGLWLSALYALLAMPPLIWAEPLMLALGQDPQLSAIAQDYTRLVALGLPAALVVMVLKSYLAALERTQVVLWVTVGSVGLNALVNYALIFGNWGAPEMGVRGAALASVAVQVASALLLALYAVRALPEHALFGRLWKPDGEALGAVFRLGWPIGLTNIAETGLFWAATLMMGWLGERMVAAHGIALNIAATTFMVHLGLSSAATVRAGRALGRNDAAGLRRGAAAAISLSLGFAFLTMLVFISFPGPLVGAFIAPDDPLRAEVIAVGTLLLFAAAVFQLGDAAQALALGLLRGVQDTRVPMVIAAFSYWLIGAPVAYLCGFALGWGGVGIWAGLAIGLGVAAILLMRRFWRLA